MREVLGGASVAVGRGGRERRGDARAFGPVFGPRSRGASRAPLKLFLGGRGADLVVFDEDAVGLGAVDEGVEELLGVGDVAFEVVEGVGEAVEAELGLVR